MYYNYMGIANPPIRYRGVPSHTCFIISQLFPVFNWGIGLFYFYGILNYFYEFTSCEERWFFFATLREIKKKYSKTNIVMYSRNLACYKPHKREWHFLYLIFTVLLSIFFLVTTKLRNRYV